MWFDCEPGDVRYEERAPFNLYNEAVVDVPPQRAFELLTDGERMPLWFKDFVACRWTSDTRGVGSTREVELKILTVKERFLAWEEGKRVTFAIEGITLPLVSAMMEDWQLEPEGANGTRFRWKVYYTPTLAMRVVHPIARAIFGGMFRDSIRSFAAYAPKA